MATFETKYVQWVQRTLNRELDYELVTNGVANSEYRSAVQTFQAFNDLPKTGEVGVPEQNSMIKANHKSTSYANWAQEALHKVGARTRGGVTGVMDSDTIASIKSFQAFHNLKDDGWIGARTEMELIESSGMLPAGHIKGSGPVIRRPKRIFYDNPKVKPFVLSVDQTVTRIISASYYDAFYNRSAYAGDDRRRRLCLLTKLKRRHGVDDQYPIELYMLRSYHGSTTYRTAKSVFSGAREYLSDRVSAMRPDERLVPIAGRVLVSDLIKHIQSGLNYIERHLTVMKASEFPHFRPQLEEIAKIVAERKRQPDSILSCFK